MVSDAQRLDLYTGLVEGLGQGRADVLMQLLPGAGWADLARRSDLDMLRAEIDAKLGAFDAKLGAFEGNLGRLEGRLYAAMAAQIVVVAGLVSALR